MTVYCHRRTLANNAAEIGNGKDERTLLMAHVNNSHMYQNAYQSKLALIDQQSLRLDREQNSAMRDMMKVIDGFRRTVLRLLLTQISLSQNITSISFIRDPDAPQQLTAEQEQSISSLPEVVEAMEILAEVFLGSPHL